MWGMIKSNFLLPLALRAGSLSTGALVGIGANSTHADWVGTGVAGALLIGVELGFAWLRKRAIVDKTYKEVVDVLYPEQANGN